MLRHVRVISAAVGLLLAAGCQSQASRLPYAFRPAETAAVRVLLAGRPGWRLATRSDNADPQLDSLRRREPGYEPYLRRGDWDRDGREDFAVVLRRDTAFVVYWFRAKAEGGYQPAAEVAAAAWLREGGLFSREGALVLAPFASDELWIFRWDAARSELRLVDSDSGG